MSPSDNQDSSVPNAGMDDRKPPSSVRAYHGYFEGYSEVAVPGRNGKGTRIQRVYTGDYFRQDLTAGQRTRIRLLYVVLFLSAVALYVSNAILPLASNSAWYVTLPQAASIVFLAWIIIAFYSYLPAKQDMTIAEYRSSSLALLKATRGSAISLGLVAVANLLFIALNPSNEPLRELLGAGKYVISAWMTLAINRIEKKVTYLSVPSQHQPPQDSVEIN